MDTSVKRRFNKALHRYPAPDRYYAGLPVPACLPVGRHGRRAGADRRSMAAAELGRYI